MKKSLSRMRPGPQLKPNTVRIYANGTTMRIGPELLEALGVTLRKKVYFTINVVTRWREHKVIRLTPGYKGSLEGAAGWPSSKRSKSLLVNVYPAIFYFGLDKKKSPGVYRARVIGSGGGLLVFLGKKIK